MKHLLIITAIVLMSCAPINHTHKTHNIETGIVIPIEEPYFPTVDSPDCRVCDFIQCWEWDCNGNNLL
ncbi:hypothetical protein LCGC14_0514850 [marine sediment metagenome]|uniref:Uncharacterized protein n=1 Tax=marine sediment metagenome TaxID=412755 RepID=A0A0F9S4V4_9ZZZZ